MKLGNGLFWMGLLFSLSAIVVPWFVTRRNRWAAAFMAVGLSLVGTYLSVAYFVTGDPYKEVALSIVALSLAWVASIGFMIWAAVGAIQQSRGVDWIRWIAVIAVLALVLFILVIW